MDLGDGGADTADWTRFYYTAPVVTFQRRVVELQRFRAMSTLALGVPWWILWVVAAMVGAKWLVDVDLYAQSPRWIQLSIAIGVVGMILTVWLAGRLGARSASPRCRQILDDLAGHSLGRVKRSLDEIGSFRAGEPHCSAVARPCSVRRGVPGDALDVVYAVAAGFTSFNPRLTSIIPLNTAPSCMTMAGPTTVPVT